MSLTGQRIKERRKQLEMSADDVASELNVSRSTIFRYENGNIEKVPANILEKLADILKTTPAYLMGWEGSAEDDINLKKAVDEDHQTEERFQSIGQKALPGDRDKIANMAEMFLTLTDIGKKKAYDYVIDLSEQSKYVKQPDNQQTDCEQSEFQVTDDVK